MSLSVLFSFIGAMAVMVAIGVHLHKRIRFEGEVKQTFVHIIVNVTMPCMIVNGLLQLRTDAELLGQMLLVLLLAIFVHTLGIAMGFVAFTPFRTVKHKTRKELAILSGLGNSGFLGIPLCAVLFGPKGALLAAVFDTGLDIVLWSYVVFMLRENARWSFSGLKSMLNAPMFAVVIGLALSAVSFEPPVMMKQLLSLLGGATVPLAMLYIGLLLAQLAASKPKVRFTLLSVPLAVKLLALPAVMMAMLYVLLPNRDIAQVVVLQSAMPTLAIASILFADNGGDEHTAAVTTAISTVLSVITVPIILLIFQRIPY